MIYQRNKRVLVLAFFVMSLLMIMALFGSAVNEENLQQITTSAKNYKVSLEDFGAKQGSILDISAYDVQAGGSMNDGVLQYKGKKVNIKNFPEKTTFKLTKNGIEVVVDGSNLKSEDLDKQGNYKLTFAKETNVDGMGTYKGSFHSLDGILRIPIGGKATVNGILIDNPQSVVVLGAGTDGESFMHFISPTQVELGGDGFSATFLPGNAFAQVDTGDHLVMRPHNNGVISVDRNGVTAEVNVRGQKGKQEWATIENGKFVTTFGNKGIINNRISDIFGDGKGSVPMKVNVNDENGNNLLQNHFLYYDNDNNQIFLPDTARIDETFQYTCPP